MAKIPSFLRSASQRGFTLIEVLISIVLLVFISLAIYQATTETYRLRDVLMNEGDFHNTIRLSMDVVQRDITALYSPLIIMPPTPQASAAPVYDPTNELASGPLSEGGKFWGPAVNKSGLRPSHFEGNDRKMSFVTASHIRIYRDSPESEFSKVTYELKPGERSSSGDETLILVRTESPNAFLDDESKDTLKRTYALLPGIRKFKIRYWRRDKEKWEASWDSESQDQKNIYPTYIELTLEVSGPTRLFFEGLYKFRPEIPLDGIKAST